MTKLLQSCCLLLVPLFLVSCVTATPEEQPVTEQKADKLAEYREAIAEAKREIKAERYHHARSILEPLRDNPDIGREARLLLNHLELRAKYGSLESGKEISKNLALDEIEERLIFPETYRETLGKDPKLGPFDLQKGPMEDLLNQTIDLNLQNADLQTLITKLSEIDGLNIIADDGLGVDKTLTIIAKEVPLKEIFDYIERNMGLAFHYGKNIVWVSQGEDRDGAPRLFTEIIRLRKGYIPKISGGGEDPSADFGGGGGGGDLQEAEGEDDLEEVLRSFLEENPDNPENAKFEIYRNRNLLVMRNTRDNIRLAQQIIEYFDKDPLQVLIEARYLTVSHGDLDQFGTAINRLRKANVSKDVTGEGDPVENEGISILNPLSALTADQAPGTLDFIGTLNNLEYDITLSALKQLESTKTLTAPRVTVINNHMARMRQGDKRFYYEEFDVESTNGGGGFDGGTTINQQQIIPRGRPQELELGITLEVLPSISNDNKSITMAINSEIIDFVGFELFGSQAPEGGFPGDTEEERQRAEENAALIKLPNTSESSIKTVVICNSKETVVMGGQLKTLESKRDKKIPFLGNIPIIGWLFRQKESTVEPQHLIIFVTATIIDPDGRSNVAKKPKGAVEKKEQ